jgi:hypothetical protein
MISKICSNLSGSAVFRWGHSLFATLLRFDGNLLISLFIFKKIAYCIRRYPYSTLGWIGRGFSSNWEYTIDVKICLFRTSECWIVYFLVKSITMNKSVRVFFVAISCHPESATVPFHILHTFRHDRSIRSECLVGRVGLTQLNGRVIWSILTSRSHTDILANVNHAQSIIALILKQDSSVG